MPNRRFALLTRGYASVLSYMGAFRVVKSSDKSFFKTIFGATAILFPKNMLGGTPILSL